MSRTITTLCFLLAGLALIAVLGRAPEQAKGQGDPLVIPTYNSDCIQIYNDAKARAENTYEQFQEAVRCLGELRTSLKDAVILFPNSRNSLDLTDEDIVRWHTQVANGIGTTLDPDRIIIDATLTDDQVQTSLPPEM